MLLRCLQNPKDKRKIILDEKLSKLFKPPVNAFSINKQISKHVFAAGASLPRLLGCRPGHCSFLKPRAPPWRGL